VQSLNKLSRFGNQKESYARRRKTRKTSCYSLHHCNSKPAKIQTAAAARAMISKYCGFYAWKLADPVIFLENQVGFGSASDRVLQSARVAGLSGRVLKNIFPRCSKPDLQALFCLDRSSTSARASRCKPWASPCRLLEFVFHVLSLGCYEQMVVIH